MIEVRTLREGEPFPQHLETGFEHMPVINRFCWVAELGKEIIGILMAAPCHGLVYFVRMRVPDESPSITAALLFRTAIRDLEKLGFKGYFTHVDPTRPAERAMIPICRKAGGLQVVTPQVPLVGSIEKAARF